MTYVISDIHGDLAGLRSVLEQIRLRPEDVCVSGEPVRVLIQSVSPRFLGGAIIK